jgi:nicotinamidase-related amidase
VSSLKIGPLRFGPLSRRTVHLCVDMQNLFHEPTPWHTPWMARVLPAVVRLAERCPERTVFTRFITPGRPEDAHGAWRRYYRHWEPLTREHVNPRLLELVPPLQALVPPATTVDKSCYSAFRAPALAAFLRAHEADSVIVSGAETDVCVLATVLDAVDRGLRVVIPADAVCGSADATHDALMQLYSNRFSQQIETTTVEQVLEAWPV